MTRSPSEDLINIYDIQRPQKTGDTLQLSVTVRVVGGGGATSVRERGFSQVHRLLHTLCLLLRQICDAEEMYDKPRKVYSLFDVVLQWPLTALASAVCRLPLPPQRLSHFLLPFF